MKIRVRFTKNECIKYLGHLDIMRAFQKCMNRADIAMVYSGGFNPHQKMSFALPLGVGIMSRAEYMDAEIADGQDLSLIKERLQEVSGPGFDILSVKELKEGALKAMAAVRFADFAAEIKDNPFTGEHLDGFLGREEILCLKKTKKGEKTENIRPMICQMTTGPDVIRMRLCAGSENNLKAETALKALYEMYEIPYDRETVSLTRTELMGEGFVPLDLLGTE